MSEYKYIAFCKKCNKQFNRKAKQYSICSSCIGKDRKTYTHKCICGKTVTKYVDFQYCSLKCSDKGKETHFFVECFQCKKKIKKLPSDLKNKTNFCSRLCQHQYKRDNSIAYRVNPTKSQFIEVMMKYAYKCGLCKAKHEFDYPLNLHHIDDNPRNTVVENLMPLCISCHRRVSIYKARGKDGLVEVTNLLISL